MVSCRNQIVSRAFRRRAGQDRGGDFHKIVSDHGSAQISDNLAAQYDLGLNFRVSQIQITVLQTDIFIRILGVVNLERKLVVAALSENGQCLRNNLDFSGRKVRVLGAALAHGSGDFNGRLVVDGGQLFHDILGFYYDLSGSVKISENHKSQVLADLTEVFIPADKLYFLADIGQSQLAAIVCTSLHWYFILSGAFCPRADVSCSRANMRPAAADSVCPESQTKNHTSNQQKVQLPVWFFYFPHRHNTQSACT